MMSRIRFWVFTTLSLALPVIVLGLLAVQPAHSQKVTDPETKGSNLPDGGVAWCVGDGSGFTTQTVAGTSYPDTTEPDGLPNNPTPVGDGSLWDSSPILEYGDFGQTALTQNPGGGANDQYGIQVNYYSSTTSNSSIGYSTGNSCILFYYNAGNTGQFEITYPANPNQAAPVPGGDQNNEQTIWAKNYTNSFPYFGHAPFSQGNAQGQPTGYVSTFKGCSWDANSCTPGSHVLSTANPNPPTSDGNSFPQLLSTLTSIPTTWNITTVQDGNGNLLYGAPFTTDGSQIWDASYDIWFDKTAQTGVGQAACTGCNARGQNDGLEIMVWMNSEHSYVDNDAVPANGYIQPSGSPMEQVVINNALYDVWTSRLNNPYFGYLASQAPAGVTNYTVLGEGIEPYTCPTLPDYLTKGDGSGTHQTNPAPGASCGTDWNVVSFVATKDNSGNDSRGTGMSMDTKVFTDYILGIQDGLWAYPTDDNRYPHGSSTRGTDGVLMCPASSLSGPSVAPTADCLNSSWYLTSVMAGFETWSGGNGLESQSFQAHVMTTSTAVQSGILSQSGQPTVNWQEPFQVVYTPPAGCTPNPAPTFYIQGVLYGTTTTAYYPGVNGDDTQLGTPITMTLIPGTNLYGAEVNAAGAAQLYPIHGNAAIYFQSSCGNNSVNIFIDPSGQVFYSDGKTPVQGATVTLLSSTSASGPFTAVPNHNDGLSSDLMAPDDNTLNPMASTQYGAYAWDVAPGYYEVTASLKGCGSVTSPVQHVVSNPITNLYLILPCAAPPPLVPVLATTGPVKSLTATAASSSQINLNWSAVSLPAGASSLTYTVREMSPASTVVASGLSGTSYSVTGLNANSSYTYAVTAMDSAGASLPSPLASATTQAAATGNCHVTYTVTNAIPGVVNGLTVNINIQNTGKTPIYPWTLGWTFPGNQKITNTWNVNESQSGEAVSMSSIASWESIPAGATLSGAVGFNGYYTGTNPNPTTFTLNGQTCK